MSDILVTEIPSIDAHPIWENSLHGTVFTKPSVLEKLASEVRWFIAKKGNEILCCWPICLDLNKQPDLPGFSYFVGPFWTKLGYETPKHRILSRRLEVYESFILKFEEEFGGFFCSLPVGLTDVRAFDWWNYHSDNKPRIKISPRYTAQISYLGESFEPEKFFRGVRRRELRKAEKDSKFELCDYASPEMIFDLYASTMERQGVSVNKGLVEDVKRLHNLVSDGEGFLTVIKDKLADQIAFVALILRAKGVSNLVLSLTKEDYRTSGVSVYGIHNSIINSMRLGDFVFDFNGANSPKRGDDKHSYGAEEKLYFDIKYETNL